MVLVNANKTYFDFARFDGTGRTPRPEQLQALAEVTGGSTVLQLPTGVGKSAVARALQLAGGAAVVVPNNALLDQYGETYPQANFVKGLDHYPSEEAYRAAVTRAERGEPTIYNPISLYYRNMFSDLVVIDEAHKLPGMMRLVHGDRFSRTKYNPPRLTEKQKPELGEWLLATSRRYNGLGSLYKEQNRLTESFRAFSRARKLLQASHELSTNPDDYLFWYEEDGTLVLEPVEIGRHIYQRVLGRRTVLMSATIPKVWAERILGRSNFHYYASKSPIPIENRRVQFDPQGFTSTTSPALIAAWIKKHVAEHQNANTIVHVTYGLAQKLLPYLPTAHLHTARSKSNTLAKFKREGGIWLAAGASEGIDLPGDTARLNLVPVLPYANIGSPYVREIRKRYPGEYELETLITFIQQVGRTTRGVDDYSTAVCGDSRLPHLIKKCRGEVPEWFLEAIQWSKPHGT